MTLHKIEEVFNSGRFLIESLLIREKDSVTSAILSRPT
jgi:hypothetical protein